MTTTLEQFLNALGEELAPQMNAAAQVSSLKQMPEEQKEEKKESAGDSGEIAVDFSS